MRKNNFIYAPIASWFCSSTVPIALPAGRQVSGGEMNWIKADEVPKVRRTPSEDAFGKIFDHVGNFTTRNKR